MPGLGLARPAQQHQGMQQIRLAAVGPSHVPGSPGALQVHSSSLQVVAYLLGDLDQAV